MDRLPPALDNAIAEHEARQSTRYVEELKLQKAKRLMETEAWGEALQILRPLWQTMTYRKEGWWDIVEDITWALRTCAAHAGDGASVIAADWELMSMTFQPKLGWPYNLGDALKGLDNIKEKPSVTIREPDVHSFLSSTFAFEDAEGKVADSCTCQLTITSHASKNSVPVAISNITIAFEGGLKPISIRHDPKIRAVHGANKVDFVKVDLSEESLASEKSLVGQNDLEFAPGQSKVFEFKFVLREFGPARAVSAKFSIISEAFDLNYIVDFDQVIVPDIWWAQKAARKRLVRIDPYVINVLPKPPKMDIRFIDLYEQYYTNEAVKLQLEITNGEAEDSSARLKVYNAGDHGPQINLRAISEDVSDGADTAKTELALGVVPCSKSTMAIVEIPASDEPAAYDLIVEISYNLVSDPETPISRTMSIRLFVVSPFEANYEFAPRFDPLPWPSFFTHEEGKAVGDGSSEAHATPTASGLLQRWSLTSRYASFAVAPLHITKLELSILVLGGGITCKTSAQRDAEPTEAQPIQIAPNTLEEATFDIVTQKISLDDRRSGSLDLAFSISWRRTQSSELNTTHVPIPRLVVASQEPRVLLSCGPHATSTPSSPTLVLSYTIENPSMHFLTFGTVMNPSESFAFSGPKTGTIQLAPLSRRIIRFVVLPSPNSRGTWIRPNFVVKDQYFQKVLRVSPGEGCRAEREKDGLSVWVPASEDD